MSKLGRFSLGVVVTIVLLASLILTAASVMALPDLPDPGNPGPVLPPPALATATPTPVPEDEEEDQDEDDDEDGDEDEDDGPGQPEATATPTPRATTPPAQGASPSTPRRSPTTAKAACVIYSSFYSDNRQGFPFLDIPGVVTIGNVPTIGELLNPVHSYFHPYGVGDLAATGLSKYCATVQERFMFSQEDTESCFRTDSSGAIVKASKNSNYACPNDGNEWSVIRDYDRMTLDQTRYAATNPKEYICPRDGYYTAGTPARWTSIGSTYCVRMHPRGAAWR